MRDKVNLWFLFIDNGHMNFENGSENQDVELHSNVER